MLKSSFARFFMFAAVVALLGMLSDGSLASLNQERGSVTGTVMTADGKPAVGINVKLVKDIPRDIGRPGRGGAKGKSGGFDSGAAELQGKPQERTKTIATATTDAQGKFNMPNIEPGDYRLEGGNKNMGWIYMDVNVQSGKATDIGEIKMAKLD